MDEPDVPVKSGEITVPEKPCFLDGEVGDQNYAEVTFEIYPDKSVGV